MKPLLTLLFFFAGATAFPQTGSVSGVVTDSLTGQPVASVSVFIPSTTSGTTTDQKGAYHLDRLNPGDYVLMFRHMSYPSYSRFITIESGKPVVLNLIMAEQSKKLKEVVIVGKLADPRVGNDLFLRYFLGDNGDRICTLENPQDLSYYYDGDVLKVVARQPLKITNRHLGYRITYFLDYFRYVEKTDTVNSLNNTYFGYSGSAMFEDLSPVMPFNAIGWKYKRSSEFTGSLRHFLACLYRNGLKNNHYYVRRAFTDQIDLQRIEKQSNAMTKIRYAQTDSLFTWKAASGKLESLHYYPDEDFAFQIDELGDNPADMRKTLSTNALLLVFNDFLKSPDLRDDCISTLQAPGGEIIFDGDGNYWVKTGSLNWVSLDNTLQIKRLLPFDYMPAIKQVRETR